MRLALVAAFFSGAASLVYQVCWTRRLADVTSATAYAQALVLAVFFAGLAAGAWGAGRIASRLRRPLLGYVALELGALLAALLSLPAFSACEMVGTLARRAGASSSVTLELALALASALMLVPTTLLGASLPVLLEACQRSAAESRRVVGALYGINTLGWARRSLASWWSKSWGSARRSRSEHCSRSLRSFWPSPQRVRSRPKCRLPSRHRPRPPGCLRRGQAPGGWLPLQWPGSFAWAPRWCGRGCSRWWCSTRCTPSRKCWWPCCSASLAGPGSPSASWREPADKRRAF